MRLLMVVQRYGVDVGGGAEQLCRMFATRMAGRGHAVDVLTTCAVSYADWANHYPAGTSELEGVTLHRLPVARPRDHAVFGRLQQRVVATQVPAPWYLQLEWMRQQGPDVPGLVPWLEERAGRYDLAVFFTYLYNTTWAGLPVAARQVPTLLHPTAHDEPPLYLGLFETLFRHPHALGFLCPEEAAVCGRRFGFDRPHGVVGVGVDLERAGRPGRDERVAGFRRRWGLGERPYLLYVGRLDPHKGTEELYDMFVTYKQRNPGPLALVCLGDPVKPLPSHPDVVSTGYVDDETRWVAMEGMACLVHPSYFESFSMVLPEAWAVGKPVIVQGRSEVLVGQCRRSGGGVPYGSFGEFEAAVETITADPALAGSLGRAGRRHVEANLGWPDVLDRYERLLQRTATMGRFPAYRRP